MQKANETRDHLNQDGGRGQDAQEIQRSGENSFWRMEFHWIGSEYDAALLTELTKGQRQGLLCEDEINRISFSKNVTCILFKGDAERAVMYKITFSPPSLLWDCKLRV